MDFMRNPAIQLLTDNLDIGHKAYKIHTNTIDKNAVQDYVSDIINHDSHGLILWEHKIFSSSEYPSFGGQFLEIGRQKLDY